GEITNTTVGTHINITERKKAEEELSKHREHLEELVKERTAKLEKSQQSLALLLEDVNESRTELDISNKKLENSNKELEAFAYSVSHDLRAPLRAIDGFTRILMEDYIEKLDDEGKRLGTVIQKNSQKMGKLIDDLLAFSRLGRASMKFSSIDMKNMAKAIYHEATGSSERKRINFSVADLPDVDGDSNMFRQVWMNLISNAIKFSSKKEKAVISITGIQDDEKITYRISDNGAGFDMQYKNKIFDVFQRLHNERDFAGTGVGLALVQRIINRHNGKIWAESEVDKGATFYFSLPKKVK
ncbi:GHKL domain-containing protein, partial [candidate division KSB1 bacterium]|nr:GHKL domain-containing protein [candidate division KSB1 bacterium]